jgi:hypothetical protein
VVIFVLLLQVSKLHALDHSWIIGCTNTQLYETVCHSTSGDPVHGMSGKPLSGVQSSTTLADTIIFDLSHAYQPSSSVVMEIRFRSDSLVHALDFALRYNEQIAVIDSISVTSPSIQYLYYYNPADSTLRFTSNSLNPYVADSAVARIWFGVLSGPFCSGDIFDVESYLNGDVCGYDITNCVISGIDEQETERKAGIYPNPVRSEFNITLPGPAKVYIFSVSGTLLKQAEHTMTAQPIDISELPDGIYMVKIDGGDFEFCEKLLKVDE